MSGNGFAAVGFAPTRLRWAGRGGGASASVAPTSPTVAGQGQGPVPLFEQQLPMNDRQIFERVESASSAMTPADARAADVGSRQYMARGSASGVLVRLPPHPSARRASAFMRSQATGMHAAYAPIAEDERTYQAPRDAPKRKNT
jgi:hypothetical protein